MWAGGMWHNSLPPKITPYVACGVCGIIMWHEHDVRIMCHVCHDDDVCAYIMRACACAICVHVRVCHYDAPSFGMCHVRYVAYARGCGIMWHVYFVHEQARVSLLLCVQHVVNSKWHMGMMMMCRLRVRVTFVHARVRVRVYVQVAYALCSGGMRHVPYAHHAACGVCVCNVRRVLVRARVRGFRAPKIWRVA
jgi:hypothetical protein